MPFHGFTRVGNLSSSFGRWAVALLLLATPAARAAEVATTAGAALSRTPNARDLILAPHAGSAPIDEQIRKAQAAAKARIAEGPSLLKLGHLFLAKARLTDDAGFYRPAEQCAVAIAEKEAENADALLLRGHCLAAMHRFAEAEAVGRRLIALRENFLDRGLLGDALMEQGKLAEAIQAYQEMADLKPSFPVYSRVAHVRWLKGDLTGAIEAAEQAIQSSHPRDAEPLAWATNRLARYRWQEGNETAALQLVARALELVPNYAPALLTRGLIHLGQSRNAEAVAVLRVAATSRPLPEYRWALAEALRSNGDVSGAAEVEQQLRATGAMDDPRTYAVILATTGAMPEQALELARAELKTRQDHFSHDAHAWALRAAGKTEAAAAEMERALGVGTIDARLALHAGVIFSEAGKTERALTHVATAESLRRMLLPSEQRLLAEKRSALSAQPTR